MNAAPLVMTIESTNSVSHGDDLNDARRLWRGTLPGGEKVWLWVHYVHADGPEAAAILARHLEPVPGFSAPYDRQHFR